MRVMVIGARGQLGTDLVKAFGDCEVNPFTSDDMDIVDEAKVQQQVAFAAPDLVINAAAFTRVDECEREHETAFRTNAVGTLNVARACRKWDVPFMHISTNYVFDGTKGAPYVETDIPQPLNAYGITKLAGEQYLQYTWPKHYIVRVSGLFGIMPSRMKGTNFVETMLRLGGRGTALRIVDDESLSPTYTADAARVLRKLVETKAYGMYHLANRGGCTWFNFAKMIFAKAGLEVALEPVSAEAYGAPARRPLDSQIENRALRGLGLDEMPSWEDALERYLKERCAGEGT